MLTRIRNLSVLLAACLGACDSPTDSRIQIGNAPWHGTFELSAPVGDELFPFQWEFQRVIDYVGGGEGFADAILNETAGGWFYRCRYVGVAVFDVIFKDDHDDHTVDSDTLKVRCSPVKTIKGTLVADVGGGPIYGRWVHIAQYVGTEDFQVTGAGDVLSLEFRIIYEGRELRCTKLGTFRYLMISTLASEFPDWYEVECGLLLPLSIPATTVVLSYPEQVSVAGVSVSPANLAEAVVTESGTIELRCLRTGSGDITVFFSGDEPPDAAYRLTCEGTHEQGGGG